MWNNNIFLYKKFYNAKSIKLISRYYPKANSIKEFFCHIVYFMHEFYNNAITTLFIFCLKVYQWNFEIGICRVFCSKIQSIFAIAIYEAIVSIENLSLNN